MIRIDILPDDVLLDIFDFCVDIDLSRARAAPLKAELEAWQLLVHVCRRWRSLVFGSPRRLNLRLFCTTKTHARDTLDVWPALPLLIYVDDDMAFPSGMVPPGMDMENVVVALGQSSRVCEVSLSGLGNRQWDEVLAAMQVPFPELINLQLSSIGEIPPVPDSFLGGSAPRLLLFKLSRIPFPGLPKLLLSATHLVELNLSNMPHSGYISPESMAALLSVLPTLKELILQFLSPRSHPDWESRRPPPSKRSVIPALERFDFKGVIEYLEGLVTFIDAPQLYALFITFFNQIDFDGPRLAQFINRTRILKRRHVGVEFDDSTAIVRHHSSLNEIVIRISCREPDWQLSSVAQVCNSCLPPLSMIEDLYIGHRYSKLVWKIDAIENTLWLELLLPFHAVKNLYLSKDFAPGIAAALQEVVGTEVLPSLQKIRVKDLGPWGPFQKNIGQFVAARELSGHPIAISIWR